MYRMRPRPRYVMVRMVPMNSRVVIFNDIVLRLRLRLSHSLQ
eukprot:02890.XXX_9374_9499_1 [CDS] Oithona nana genome sequencing.